MKTEGQVRHQFQQVLYRHTKRHLEEHLAVTPSNCKWNRNPAVTGSVCVCVHAAHAGTACDVAHGGRERARGCFEWEPQRTKDEIKLDIRNLVQGDRGALARTMPDVVALQWVLEDTPDLEDLDVPDELLEGDDDSEYTSWANTIRMKVGWLATCMSGLV